MLKWLLLHFFVLFIYFTSIAQTNPIITSWIINDSSNKSSAIKSVCFSQNLVYIEKIIQKSQKKNWITFPLNPDTANHNKKRSKQFYSGMLINGALLSFKISEKNRSDKIKNQFTFNKNNILKISQDSLLVNGQVINLNYKKHSHIIGFANDGFPIYGPFGFYNKNGTGEILRMKSSFHLKSNKKGKVSTNTNTFNKYYIFKQLALPDFLDEHNGRFCVTPEYPQGTYCYFLTIDSSSNPVYPFLIGPTLFGNSLSKIVDTIEEPFIKYANLKNKINLLKKEEKLPFTIFFAEKSELIVIQSNGMINEDVKLQLYDESGIFVKETTLYQGSTIAYFDAQALYNAEYTIKIIRSSGSTEQKIMINKSL
jgi:hypothetical protein